MSYADFLERKSAGVEKIGREFHPNDVHQYLHPWQREIVAWAATTGRAAIWADTGLGKTLMQLEWARLTADEGTALIVAPLAVCAQTAREAGRGVGPTRCGGCGMAGVAMNHDLERVCPPPVFGATVWLCTCGHRSFSEDDHITHVEIEPHPAIRGKP